MGRFLSRDPIGHAGGLNLYEYSKSNPTTFTDHTGLYPDSVRAGIIAAIKSGDLATAAALTKEMVSFYGLQAVGAAGGALYQAQQYMNQAWAAAQRGIPNCTQVASKLFEAFRAAGGNPQYVKLTSDFGNILHKTNMNLSIGNGYHYAVLYQGRIYDAFVGLKGVPQAQYINQFVGEGLKWVTVTGLP